MNRFASLAALLFGLASVPAQAADGETAVHVGLFGLTYGNGPRTSGSGRVVDETRALVGFTALVLSAPVDVTLKAGNSERATVRADDNLLPLIETRVIDGRLEIGIKSGASFRTRHPLKATVEFKQLDAIRIKGSGDVRADTIKAPVLEIAIGGSGDVTIDQVEVDALAVSVHGSGDVIARGRAVSVGVVVDGSGDVDVAGVEARQAAVRIRGSGDVKVNAADTLEVDVSGSGDVRYRGLPQIKKKVRGSGTVAPMK